MTSSTPAIRHHPLYGVHGWLLWFILSLVLGGPADYLGHHLHMYRQIMAIPRVHHSYSLHAIYVIEQLAILALNCYGIFVGIQLWRVRPLAVVRAKRFLIALLAFRVADYLTGLTWAALMSTDPARLFQRIAFGNAFRYLWGGALYVAVWYAYLVRSKRIRITFPSPERDAGDRP